MVKYAHILIVSVDEEGIRVTTIIFIVDIIESSHHLKVNISAYNNQTSRKFKLM